jgi:uncharacterized protein (DUF362 family)
MDHKYIKIKRVDDRSYSALVNIYQSKAIIKKYISSVFELENKNEIEGKNILIKPNWVQQIINTSDEYCLHTNHNFIYALVEIILERKPQMVVIGDAPLQGCKWKMLVTNEFYDTISYYSKYFSIPIQICDFRRTILDRKNNKVIKDRIPLNRYIIFDLGDRSILEPISKQKSIFRVTDYDPRKLAESHKKGVHKYCITKELFDADLIISVPKIKTHQKTGITCALKNLVGLNGDKDFLPHHRVGGIGFGGDCYPGKNYLRRLSEYLIDISNKKIGQIEYKYLITIAKILWHINHNDKYHHWSAAWYGNDTCWRMVLDLNLIALFGTKDGIISNNMQRKIYTLCDGIIAGQGNGPLKPYPLPLGIISFSNNSVLTDLVITNLMGFDYTKIPLVREALNIFPIGNYSIKINEQNINFEELIKYRVNAEPAPGWKGHIEYEG